jgi:DNA-binding transcriptional LysR family regulator
MELRLVRSFVAVAEELSFSRAALRLGLSQPPLTRQIQALEADLCQQLFLRDKRGVQLTTAGEIVLAEAYKLLEQSRRFVASGKAAARGARPLRLACSASGLTEVVPLLIPAYREICPQVSMMIIECNNPSIIGRVIDGDIDVAITRLARAPAALSMMPLMSEKMFVALPRAHELAASDELSIDCLQALDLVVPSGRALPGYLAALEMAFAAAGLQLRYLHECETIGSLLGLVAAGLAVAVVPRKVPVADVAGIAFVPLKGHVRLPRLALVWGADRMDRYVQAIVQAAKATFAAEPVIPNPEDGFLS